MRAIREITPAPLDYIQNMRAQADQSAQRGRLGWVCPPLGRFGVLGKERYFLEEDEPKCRAHAHKYAARLLDIFARVSDGVRLVPPRGASSDANSFVLEVDLPAGRRALFTVAASHAYLFDVRGEIVNWSNWQWAALGWREEAVSVGALPVLVEIFDAASAAMPYPPPYGPYKTYDPLAALTQLLATNFRSS